MRRAGRPFAIHVAVLTSDRFEPVTQLPEGSVPFDPTLGGSTDRSSEPGRQSRIAGSGPKATLLRASKNHWLDTLHRPRDQSTDTLRPSELVRPEARAVESAPSGRRNFACRLRGIDVQSTTLAPGDLAHFADRLHDARLVVHRHERHDETLRRAARRSLDVALVDASIWWHRKPRDRASLGLKCLRDPHDRGMLETTRNQGRGMSERQIVGLSRPAGE
jgi:hypothetical protein